MAKWYVGIDESGNFNWYDENDKSFVCAIVTQKNVTECNQFLEKCANHIDPDQYQYATKFAKDDSQALASVINDFYHGMDVAQNNNIKRLISTLQTLLTFGEDYFYKIYKSQPGGDSASNHQHYYVSSLKDVIKAILESKFIHENDTIEFHIAERVLEKTGAAAPIEIVLGQMHGRLNDNRLSSQEISAIQTAIRYVKQYGNTRGASTQRKQTSYLTQMSIYRQTLERSIQKFIRETYPDYNVSVNVCSARRFSLPALADQAVNILNYIEEIGEIHPRDMDTLYESKDPLNLQERIIIARKNTYIKGNNIESYIEEGDFLSAIRVFMNKLYDGHSAELSELQHVMNEADNSIKDDLWNILLDICSEKMESRGTDGDSIQKTAHLMNMLDVLVTREKSMPQKLNVLNRYYQLRGAFAAHSGDTNFEKEMEFCEKILEARDNAKSFEDHQLLYKLYIDHMTGSVAQVCFNDYDFSDTMYQTLLDEYEREIMERHTFFNNREDFIDNDYAKIVGTIGQAHMFAGNYLEGFKALEKDFIHSSKQKDMIASFLVIANLMVGNFEKAKEWFKEQSLAVLGETVSFEDFHNYIDSDTSMWLLLNYLRLTAYATKLGIPSRCPDINLWNNSREGDYPWALLLKWYAYICIVNGENEQANNLLDDCIDLLSNSTTFTINSLVLSPLRMKICLGNDPEIAISNYANSLEYLKSKSQNFSEYAEQHHYGDINENQNIWDALTMLPFNYS